MKCSTYARGPGIAEKDVEVIGQLLLSRYLHGANVDCPGAKLPHGGYREPV